MSAVRTLARKPNAIVRSVRFDMSPGERDDGWTRCSVSAGVNVQADLRGELTATDKLPAKPGVWKV